MAKPPTSVSPAWQKYCSFSQASGAKVSRGRPLGGGRFAVGGSGFMRALLGGCWWDRGMGRGLLRGHRATGGTAVVLFGRLVGGEGRPAGRAGPPADRAETA